MKEGESYRVILYMTLSITLHMMIINNSAHDIAGYIPAMLCSGPLNHAPQQPPLIQNATAWVLTKTRQFDRMTSTQKTKIFTLAACESENWFQDRTACVKSTQRLTAETHLWNDCDVWSSCKPEDIWAWSETRAPAKLDRDSHMIWDENSVKIEKLDSYSFLMAGFI